MKSVFSSLFLATLAAVALAAPQPVSDTPVLTARELSQGYRQQVVLARPVPSQRATVDGDEMLEGVRVQERFPRFGDLRIIELDAGEDLGDAIARLRATGRYEFVDPDYIRRVEVEPSEPNFSNGTLWGLKNTGASNGVAGADIQATAAWDIIREAPGVVVAVIDTGVNINHQDLAGNIWVNPAPTFGDINGARFLNGGTNANVTDDNGHGTHIAGTIGAVANNNLGITGVAWRVQIMPIKAFGSTGLGMDSDIVRAINYAIAHGAQIINASFGEDGGSADISSAQRSAIAAARNAGIIFVAAAGNAGLNSDLTPSYPASYALDNIVAVGASTRRDELATYSNFGTGVDLFAPGSDIVSLAHNSNTGTATKSGTSMAAPHVAGALALLKARFPDDTYRQLINRLLRGVNRTSRFAGKAQTGGRLNVFNALNGALNQPFNDNFADRPYLTGENLRIRANNAGGTDEAGELLHAGLPPLASLWWEWSSSAGGTVTIDTDGSGQDTVLAVYAGTAPTAALSTLTPLAANDNEPAGTATTSRLTFRAQAGTRYYIAVGSKSSDGGTVFLNLNTTPANDEFSGAQQIEGQSGRMTSYNRTATAEPGEPAVLGFRGGHTLWYRWTAPRSGRFQFSVVSPEFDPVLGIFTGSAVNALTPVAQNDNAGSSAQHNGSLCTVEAIAGTNYWILVDSKTAAASGQFTLTLVDSLWQAPTGDAVTSSPAIGPDGTIYVGGTDNSIYAFNADGSLRWSATTGGFIDTCSPAVAGDGSVYVGSNDGKVYAFYANGTTKWTRDFGSSAPMSNSPTLGPDGTVYIKAGDGYLYALNPASGVTKWRRDVHGPATYASASIAADGTIYQGSEDMNLYAINPDGTVKWTHPVDNEIYTVPAIDAAGNIYFSVLNSGNLYSLTASGVERWVYSGAALGSSSSATLSADGGTVYFGGYDGKLHAVATATGIARWTYPLGNEVRASSPAIDANGVIYIGCYDSKLHAVNPDGTLKRTYDMGDWIRSSPAIAGTKLYVGSNDSKVYAFDLGAGAAAGPWPQYRQNAWRLGRGFVPPRITTQPTSQATDAGGNVQFTAVSLGATYQWQRNGSSVTGATGPAMAVIDVQPAQAGLYQAVITGETTVTTEPVILGVLSPAKTLGQADEVRGDIVHPNTNVYDQVLLGGAAASIRADPGQIVRLSYLDLSNDIVQVEFSGAGTLSITLDNPTGPAAPQSYDQPDISYMKGHASLVIAGADETTNLSVFSVGRITAVNQSLFRSEVTYDGVADIASLAILSTNGKFGGVFTGNTSYFNTRGLTGLWAPGIQFTGPVVIGDISAADSATPVLMTGSTASTRIAGGDLLQLNGRALRVGGLSSLQFVEGTNSHGTVRPAQTNRARIEENGVDVTNRVVANPKP